MKEFFEKYSHLKSVIYFFIFYLIGFTFLENKFGANAPVLITDSVLDQYIPFNEYFVIPYLLWFVYIALGFIFFVFKDQQNFKRMCFYLFWGMGISLFIYLIIPNGQNLRVELTNENICQSLVSFLYTTDTPTNVCPSIHAYNSIMMMVALLKSEEFRKHKILMIIVVILSILICMSTVMIKQHAVVDVIGAIILAIVIYTIGKRKYGY